MRSITAGGHSEEMEMKIKNRNGNRPTKLNKKRSQVGVKLSSQLHARLRAACKLQDHREGQLAHILLEWALPFYENLGSVQTLRKLNFQHAKSQCPDIFNSSQAELVGANTQGQKNAG